MTLTDKVKLFLKLAEDGEEAEYRKFIASLTTTVHPTWLIEEQIGRNQNRPYFKIEDFLIQPVFDKMVGNNSIWVWKSLNHLTTSFVRSNIKQNNIKQLINFFALTAMEKFQFEDSADIIDFFKVRSVIDDSTFQKGQRKMVLTLMRWVKNNLWQWWVEIYNANIINDHFMMQLAKLAGPDFYRHFFNATHKGQSYVETKDKILQQSILDVGDVAIYISQGSTLDRDILLELIDKSNETAKNYMRQFLYCDNAANVGLLDGFILAEDMTPMNRHYQTIKLPREIYVSKISSWPDESEIRKVWSKIFQEFKIIPA